MALWTEWVEANETGGNNYTQTEVVNLNGSAAACTRRARCQSSTETAGCPSGDLHLRIGAEW